MKKIKILNYKAQYQQDYKRISLTWLHENDLYESIDGIMLDNPKNEILDKGGFIYLAMVDKQIAGTVTIKPSSNNSYEILKLGVDENHRRIGIGKILLEHCIQQAIELNVDKIFLESNSKLKSAIRLYTKLGFREITLHNTTYKVSDLKMELLLNK